MSVKFTIKPVPKRQKRMHFSMNESSSDQSDRPTSTVHNRMPHTQSMSIRQRMQRADRWEIHDAQPPSQTRYAAAHAVSTQPSCSSFRKQPFTNAAMSSTPAAATAASSSRPHAASKNKYRPSFLPPSTIQSSKSRTPAGLEPRRGREGGAMAAVEVTEEEIRKRELRARRFQNDQPVKRPTSSETENKEWTMDQKIIGTCTDLEKPYFRLTSAPDPSTVRTVATLKKTLKMLRHARDEGRSYSYLCEQYKSLRQDLMVQHLRGKFTVKVYEHHARVALEMADLSEFHQCQTQLMYLYKEGVKGAVGEFVAYQILYLLYAGSPGDVNAFVEQIKILQEEGRDMGLGTENVKHALSIRAALATGGYHAFFKLYQRAPERGAYLLDKFVDRTRVEALRVLCKAFRLGIPLAFISKELTFYSWDEMVDFLRRHGVNVCDTDQVLDTKSAMPPLIEHSKQYTKIDIKGQI